MEWQLRGRAAALAAALLLLLLPPPGSRGQAGAPGPRCGCAHDSPKRSGLLCCRGCPAGQYLAARCTQPCGNATCLPCPRGTFLARENHHQTSCARCETCDEQLSQVALRNCSAAAGTSCGCRPGWVMECLDTHCVGSLLFQCRLCLDCGALRRHPWVPCDTKCGTCLPGFYEHGNSCVSCPTPTPPLAGAPPGAVLGPVRRSAAGGRVGVSWVQVLLAGLVVPLLLGATLTYTYRRCQPCKPMVPADGAGMEALTPLQATHLSPSDRAHALLAPPSGSEKVCSIQLEGHSWTPGPLHTQEALCPELPWPWDQLPSRALGPPPPPPPPPPPQSSPAPPAGSAATMLQLGPQLYDVMDAVPARRWKEFVRTLGLREAEIEAVEVEVGRFRDQQYEMLKRWRQQQPAGLGAIYAALERMGLDGCAEDLRSRLQLSP
ncbi:tumor necrosis factor receptor superfamily member 25 isoform X3 [Phyllostomus hastatus]|uniref:tumor necrosis factor receptor superfamily member 25 isoform X3 n=1 Tax=Phyllostomus hastatus TaxID=9423 RepID=UPI001E684703|nr:tumor necrosis factor receptor superfamily member 25 isoform X3 [Phyllostomus hastatus]